PGVSGAGRLTVTGPITLNGGSTSLMDIATGGATNDVLVSSNNLALGGTLTVITNGGVAGGQSFKLFSASGTLSGNFTTTNLPDISPFSWNWNPASGTLSVIGLPDPTNRAQILSAQLQGGNIILHGTNLNTPGSGYRYVVLSS